MVEISPEAICFLQNLSFRCGRPQKSRKNVKRKQHFDNISTPLSHLRLWRLLRQVAAVGAVDDPQQLLQTRFQYVFAICPNPMFKPMFKP